MCAAEGGEVKVFYCSKTPRFLTTSVHFLYRNHNSFLKLIFQKCIFKSIMPKNLFLIGVDLNMYHIPIFLKNFGRLQSIKVF